MADKKKNTFAAPTGRLNSTLQPKRPSTVNGASSSRGIPQSTFKDRKLGFRSKVNSNSTFLSDPDSTMSLEPGKPVFEDEYRQIAYGKFLRAMLEDCLVNEKIEREENEIDAQITHLGMRFQQTIDLLDKTNRRMKDINFLVEEKRLLDLKSNFTSDIIDSTSQSNIEESLRDLSTKEQVSLDRLETKNIDFGFNKSSGHQQLLDAVTEALTGLDEIKKRSKLDPNKFNEYEKQESMLKSISKEKFDLESLKKEFEDKFPGFGEKLMLDTSEKITKMMEEFDDETTK